MEELFLFLSLGFAIFGLTELIHIIKLWLIFPKRRMNCYLIINLKNSTAEKQLAFAYEQISWFAGDYADYIIGLCDDLDNSTLQKCKNFAKNRSIKLISIDDLEKGEVWKKLQESYKK